MRIVKKDKPDQISRFPVTIIININDPKYAPVIDDGRENSITDLLVDMVYRGATELYLIGGTTQIYTVDGEKSSVPVKDKMSHPEFMEELEALGIMHNSHIYPYVYKPQSGPLEELRFTVKTSAMAGLLSVSLFLRETIYR